MDQLHRDHDNGRTANAPAQTGAFTEHRAAQFNDRKNTNDAIGEQGARVRRGIRVFKASLGSYSNQVRVCCCRRAWGRKGDRKGEQF